MREQSTTIEGGSLSADIIAAPDQEWQSEEPGEDVPQNCQICGERDGTHDSWIEDRTPTDRGTEVRGEMQWVCDQCDPATRHGSAEDHLVTSETEESDIDF